MAIKFDFLAQFWNRSKQDYPWWLEISTQQPNCTYYFGPFDNKQEAIAHKDGYIEDLRSENARDIAVNLVRDQPQQLTVVNDE
jgi:hypothetical protein